jgi:hypothetical protein
MTALPAEPMGAPLTVVFDSATSFADVPNLLAYHPGPSALHGWLTMKLAPIAVRKRLRPGWRVTVTGTTGALLNNKDRQLLTFELIKGHRL